MKKVLSIPQGQVTILVSVINRVQLNKDLHAL